MADSLRAVIEKTSSTFPQARIVISTLLPRKDAHPLTIHKINASISRDCALRSNVHLAHNSTMNTKYLYDHVHLHKRVVPVFAKTLKDAAFTRTTTPQTHNRGNTTTPPPITRRPHCSPRPGKQRRPQERPGPTAWPPSVDEHVPTLPHGAASPPHRLRPSRPGTLTYAQALSGTGRSAGSELGEIQQMLSLICARLVGSGSWPDQQQKTKKPNGFSFN